MHLIDPFELADFDDFKSVSSFFSLNSGKFDSFEVEGICLTLSALLERLALLLIDNDDLNSAPYAIVVTIDSDFIFIMRLL